MSTSDNPYSQGPDRYEPSGAGTPGSDEKSLAVIAHLSGLAAILLSAGWLPFVGPLIVWILFRDRGRLVRTASAGAFNFAIGITVLGIAAWICLFTIILIPVAIVLWIVAFIAQVWCSVRGAIAASNGQIYRYPFQLPLLS